MTKADLALGMRLKTQASWNQTEADWHRALELQPEGCFVAELNDAPVGTVATCVFGAVAWIGLVLVDHAARGQGIGTALMRRALQFLDDRRDIASVRLDATPLGQPLYEKLGFLPQFALSRYEGKLPEGPAVDTVASASTADHAAIHDLDQRVASTDRRRLLRCLFAEDSTSVRIVRRDGNLEGFVASRPGARALHIGPCLATTLTAGRALFTDVCHRFGGRFVYVDVPAEHRQAAATVAGLGLTVQRPFLRMCRGARVEEPIDLLWAAFGPEKG